MALLHLFHGENTISIGFNPNKIVVISGGTGNAILYNNEISTTTFWSLISGYESQQINISTTLTGFGFRKIGNQSKIYIKTADLTFYLFKTK